MSPDRDAPPPAGSGQGPATDADNQPVLDPSPNVFDLVQAAMRRQDDLRESEVEHNRRLGEEEGRHIRELIEMHAKFSELRAAHGREIRDKEESRIDAIRAVDRQAVRETAEVQATQASTIATTLAQTAEAMRSQVAAVAQQTAAAQAAALEPIQKAIDDLRRAQYEQQGQKQQVVEGRSAADDMKPILEAVAALTKAQNEGVGGQQQVAEMRAGGANVGMWIGTGIAFLALLIAVVSIVVLLSASGP